MQIFVQGLTGKTITIDVEEDNTLEVVRRKIQDKIGVSSDEHWLLYGATVLNDMCTLAQHHITREATLHLRARGRGGRLSVGFEFADLQQPREVALGALGPSWRVLRDGLNFVGPCLSSTCEARLQVVAMKVGMGRCDVARALRQFNHCPECNACVVISGCILYACEWEFRGCKMDEETETVVKGMQQQAQRCSSLDWGRIADAGGATLKSLRSASDASSCPEFCPLVFHDRRVRRSPDALPSPRTPPKDARHQILGRGLRTVLTDP
eukprot:CAMPEP_0194487854 /NCGR_PEP_ID=MMETSP0253-20130528/8001_1 /TAXON_ID=2966 /ORGANISM="Noctiluca scintillans" /LENGTH=266 /DNA_ID=CAMNT_0039328143 /DNA_START=64 /DNA_END=865 /DNA_ORIENTATION=-